MLTKDFINTKLPLLDDSHKAKEGLQVMQEFHIEQLAACINGNYGFLTYNTLHNIHENTPLTKIEQLLQKASIATKDHIWKSISTFNQHEAEALPVLDENKSYCGTVLAKDLFNALQDIFPINNGGGILELEMSYQNYSLQELGGIVEGVNAKIIQLSIFPIKGTSKVNIIFAIDKNDASDVIQALERHNYHVNAWFMNKGKIDNLLEERYDAIMKYINV